LEVKVDAILRDIRPAQVEGLLDDIDREYEGRHTDARRSPTGRRQESGRPSHRGGQQDATERQNLPSLTHPGSR